MTSNNGPTLSISRQAGSFEAAEYRRTSFESWQATAPVPETRAKRIEQTVRMAAKGLRAQFDRE